MSLCDSKSHNLSHPKATSGRLGLHIGNVVPVQEWGGESFVLRRHSCRCKLPGEKPTLAFAWSNGVVAEEANGSSQVESKFHNQWQSWRLAQQWPKHDVNIQYCPSIVHLLNFWMPPSFILSNSFGTGIDRFQHAPGGAHRPFAAGNRLQLMSSHLWSGAMWLHTLPQLTWQSWQKETLQTWYHWTININNYDLRSSQHLAMATNPKVLISIQFPSPGSCSLPSGSSNDMWPWWYKPSSGKVRSKSSNNEASRRNLWSSVCCREGCGNNAQRSIHSVLRVPQVATFLCFFPMQLDTPETKKSSCTNKKRYFYFPMFWRLMMIWRCWKICVGWPGFFHPCSFDEESLSILKQECNLWWIRMYNFLDPVLLVYCIPPPFHPAIPSFWPKDLLGFRYDSSFQLALPHHFAMRILEDEDASCPRSVGLDRFQGENQGVVVICIRLEGILDVLRLKLDGMSAVIVQC